MHISDGILSRELLIGTNLLAGLGVVRGLAVTDYERVPRVGVLAAVFFVASFIHINVGPVSVHLLMNGLLGILLGWAAFPALAAAFLLQAILLQYGGVTALGANVLCGALPAVLCYYLFGGGCRRAVSARAAFTWGSVCGVVSVLLTCVGLVVVLLLSHSENYRVVAKAVVVAHIPVCVVEGFVVGSCVAFLRQVRPELLLPPVEGRKSLGGEDATEGESGRDAEGMS